MINFFLNDFSAIEKIDDRFTTRATVEGYFHRSRSFFLRSHSTTPTLTTYTHSYPYEHTYANPTPMSIFEG